MSNEDDPILRDYISIAGERTDIEITQSILSTYDMTKAPAYYDWLQAANVQPDEDITHGLFNEVSVGDIGKQRLTDNQVAKPRFEHIYNADGTCHAFNCGAPGLILAYDEFSPEIAQWFCGMHWSQCEGVDMLTVAEDLRKPLFPAMFGTYTANEVRPGVYEHVFSAPPLGSPGQEVTVDSMTLSWSLDGKPLFEVFGAISKRAAQIYEKAIARRARDVILHQRARQRTRRQHRAAFRRRKRGLA